MSVQPEGEQLRKAIRWIGEMRLENPGAVLFALIEEACLKYDLPPKDSDFLMRYFAEQAGGKNG
ncbi:MAG: hypothetical protein M0024_08960 [Nitrospiraceae bacterium]|nr:hypothetical protein [Nitrospiraceae bacterium]